MSYDDKQMSIGEFLLVYKHRKPLVFVSLNLKGFKIIDSPLHLHYFSILLKAFVSSRLPKDSFPINDYIIVKRRRIDNQEFLVMVTGRTSETILNKVTVMELQTILERFLARIDIFDL